MKLVRSDSRALITPCVPIKDIDTEIRPWIPQLISTMRHGLGMGITANQVGKDAAVFITNVPGDHLRIFINPVMVPKQSYKVTSNEGCMSLPGKYLVAKRKRHVVIRALSLKGVEFTVDTSSSMFSSKVSAILSMCLQHEMDHINGVDMRKYIIA